MDLDISSHFIEFSLTAINSFFRFTFAVADLFRRFIHGSDTVII